jgi:hypothetical protein
MTVVTMTKKRSRGFVNSMKEVHETVELARASAGREAAISLLETMDKASNLEEKKRQKPAHGAPGPGRRQGLGSRRPCRSAELS